MTITSSRDRPGLFFCLFVTALNTQITSVATYNEIINWTGTVETSVTPSKNIFDFDLVTFLLNDSSIINAIVTINPYVVRNNIIKVYGSSGSQWMSIVVKSDGTVTLNRTSTNSTGIRAFGIKTNGVAVS